MVFSPGEWLLTSRILAQKYISYHSTFSDWFFIMTTATKLCYYFLVTWLNIFHSEKLFFIHLSISHISNNENPHKLWYNLSSWRFISAMFHSLMLATMHFDCRDLNTHINVYLASTCPNPWVFFMDLGLNHFVFISTLSFLQRLRILNILA